MHRNVSDVFDRWCGDRSVQPTRSCDATTRHIKRHRFAYSPPGAGHASPLSLGAMFRYQLRAFAAWPNDWSFPLVVRRRSWGS
jgi:hypothetical protein